MQTLILILGYTIYDSKVSMIRDIIREQQNIYSHIKNQDRKRTQLIHHKYINIKKDKQIIQK